VPCVPTLSGCGVATLIETRSVAVLPGLARPPESGDSASWSAYFEELYRDADGDPGRVPWADQRANPAMTAWLNCEAPGLIRPGASVVVVGCGLGDDVRDLCDRGYGATGFDVSPTAVQWARTRHPSLADHFMVADLFSPPSGLIRRADLVIEINTIQSFHPTLRERAASAIAGLARPRGTILVICRGRDETDAIPDQPPFPLAKRELQSLFGASGWQPTRDMDDFMDEEIPPQRRVRAVFRRS
jgi:SAM-dependent methyltransferase